MSAIRLHDLDELATKSDLAVLESKIDLVRAEIKSEIESEIAELRAEMKSDIAALRRTMSTWMLAQSVAVIGQSLGSPS
jgi:tRNA U34 5-carboxymethylaminomethyl modifying GTPase MnmE/TrmE